MRNLTINNLSLLRRNLKQLPDQTRQDGEAMLGRQQELLRHFRQILDGRLTATRTRIHGDYHLGQVLWTGRDFAIIDFEGEPALPISTRRIKRSPLRDVAGMVRSFHYAAFHGLQALVEKGLVPEEATPGLGGWARWWYTWTAAGFLRSYRRHAEGRGCLPASAEELRDLLDVYLLEKAVYELGYELNNRPGWVHLPLAGIVEQLDASP
jgi:maltose alpha-D-glucosyltransferase/alpha-amylase